MTPFLFCVEEVFARVFYFVQQRRLINVSAELGHDDGVPKWQDWTVESQSGLRSSRRHDTTQARTRAHAYARMHSHAACFSKPGDPGDAKLSSFRHYVASNCQRWLLLLHNDDQAHHCTKPFPFFFFFPPTSHPVCQMIKGFLWSCFCFYTYCLTYVVPYISLTPPWTQHIHLMQWINGSELVSALGPLGTRLSAERTLIPIHPHQIHFLALTRSKARWSDRFESR